VVSRGAGGPYPVEVGRRTLPTWTDRGRSAVGLVGMVVVLGALLALAIGLVVLLVGVVVSAAIN
jgi:hypothetical protein